MFGSMMKGIAQDFVRYVMHVQVVRNDEQQPAAPAVQNVQQTSSESQPASAFQAAAASAVASGEAPPEVLAPAATRSATAIPQTTRARQTARPAAKQETVVKDEWSKTPRNAPCPCGSGKKFKMCHGAS
jgi:preprotein translocase subunit SecA